MAFAHLKPIDLSTDKSFNERMLQDYIADSPAALGLGELIYVGRERSQIGGGRLDLLLSDMEASTRYTVEVQLGKTDPSHIIRAIEYWDLERKKFKGYDHIAVIIAEDITHRFFNVISILGNSVPMIALKVTAVENHGQVGLLFSKILDTTEEYFEVDDEAPELIVDKKYWENRGSSKTVKMAEQICGFIDIEGIEAKLNFNKHYIGLTINGQSNNFVVFHPRNHHIIFSAAFPYNDDLAEQLEGLGISTLDYDTRNQKFRLKLSPQDLDKHQDLIKSLVQQAYENWFR